MTKHETQYAARPPGEEEEDILAVAPAGDDADGEAPDAEVADEDAEDTDGEEDCDPDALVEVEHDGKSYSVPAALKGAFMRNADYTRKTQALAEQRRTHELREAHHREHFQEVSRLVGLHDAVRQLEQTDWDTLERQNPQAAHDRWQQLAMLKQQSALAAHQLPQKELAKDAVRQRETAKQHQHGLAVLAREIPDFGAPMMGRLIDFGASKFGLHPHDIANVADPRHIKVLHAAMTGHETEKAHARLKQAVAAQQSRPATQVRAGAGTTTKDPDKMTDAQYRRWRESQG